MKTPDPSDENSKEKLPFSFKKEKVSSDKIKEHWQKIAEKIKTAETNAGERPKEL